MKRKKICDDEGELKEEVIRTLEDRKNSKKDDYVSHEDVKKRIRP